MTENNTYRNQPCSSKVCPSKRASIVAMGLGPLVKRGNQKYHLCCLPERGLTKGDTIK
jgi:hypothetical protein